MAQTHYCWLLILVYSNALLMSFWFDARSIDFGWFQTEAGTLIFSTSFLLCHIITEVYGFKRARLAIITSIGLALFMLIYGWLISFLPSPDVRSASAFDVVFSASFRLIVAAYITYFLCQYINAILLVTLKRFYHGQVMGLRFMLATIIASGLDSFIFMILAYTGTLSPSEFWSILFGLWAMKVVISGLLLPFALALTKYLKGVEKLDIYDRRDGLSPFGLEATYLPDANQYKP